VFACLALIYLLVFPLFSTGWLYSHYEELPKSRFRDVYGSLYEDLETEKENR